MSELPELRTNHELAEAIKEAVAAEQVRPWRLNYRMQRFRRHNAKWFNPKNKFVEYSKIKEENTACIFLDNLDLSSKDPNKLADLRGLVLFDQEVIIFLRQADFSYTDLSDAEFRWNNFSNANFSGAKLYLADLRGANLTGANFSRTNLSCTHFIGANLSGANFSGAYLKVATLRGANLSGANFSRADLSCIHFIGANLSGANLTGAINLDSISSYENIKFSRNTQIPDNAPEWMKELHYAASLEDAAYAQWKDGKPVAYNNKHDIVQPSGVSSSGKANPAARKSRKGIFGV